MSSTRVDLFSISLDGFGAGADQGLEFPLGRKGEDLHNWMTATGRFGEIPPEITPDHGLNSTLMRGADGTVGATIMGRNMFGPIRGTWDAETEWKGWWGDNPPFHHPVFVLTHHPHDPIEMDGGTTFHFVTGGIEDAHAQAVDAANGQDIRIGGGASTIQQYMNAGLIDRLHITIAPVFLGGGEPLFANLSPKTLEQYAVIDSTTANNVVHLLMAKKRA